MRRLKPAAVGRGRALEVLLGAGGFSGELAERYGYVNRAIPDAELDAFMDAFARRVAGFEKSAVAETKTFVDQATLADDSVFPTGMNAFFRSARQTATGARVGALVREGFQMRNDVEARLPYHLGEYVKA